MLPLTDDARVRVLAAVARKGPLYGARRVVTITMSLAILLAVPLLGIARVDVWRGNHILLGARTTWFSAATGVVVATLALYAITFVTNLVGGRFFCGWGCPVGFVGRLGENVRLQGKRRARGLLHHALGAMFVATFIAASMLWFVDPHVVTEGSSAARGAAAAVFVVLCAGGWFHAFVWRFGFCLHACPIGLYYRFVTSSPPVGIVFAEVPDPCTGCNACVRVCPVHLDPRRLGDDAAPVPPSTGNDEGRFADAECLRCGDCVEACRMIFAIRPKATPPLRFGARAPAKLDGGRADGSHRATHGDAATNADAPGER